MPTYTQAPANTSPTYSQAPNAVPVFDDAHVLFDDPVVQFDGDTVVYSMPGAASSPAYTPAAAPS